MASQCQGAALGGISGSNLPVTAHPPLSEMGARGGGGRTCGGRGLAAPPRSTMDSALRGRGRLRGGAAAAAGAAESGMGPAGLSRARGEGERDGREGSRDMGYGIWDREYGCGIREAAAVGDALRGSLGAAV